MARPAECGLRPAFSIFIDGKDVGITAPGSDGITKDVGVGSHSVSARLYQILPMYWRRRS